MIRRRTRDAVLLAAFVAPALLLAADGHDWPMHHGDLAGQRYSPLKQITPANVATLHDSLDVRHRGISAAGDADRRERRDVSHAPDATSSRSSPRTGIRSGSSPRRRRSAGAASRTGPATAHVAPRIFTGAGDRLIALDAETGQPAASFGDSGGVDLKASVRGDVDGGFSLASPPTIFKNMVITGGNNGEQSPSLGLYGDIRAWDARTGKLLWSFHTVPRAGEPGVETWEGDSWKNRSGTNMWAFFTIDEQRGLLFAPIGAPTSDYYGGDRQGEEPVRQLDRRARHQHGRLEVVPAARAPRPLGLRHARGASLVRCDAQRPDDPRRRRDHEDVRSVHLRSRDRRADLRNGRTSRPAQRCPGRSHLADATVPGQAGTARRGRASILRRTSTR